MASLYVFIYLVEKKYPIPTPGSCNPGDCDPQGCSWKSLDVLFKVTLQEHTGPSLSKEPQSLRKTFTTY
jgi:hypothetical protein